MAGHYVDAVIRVLETPDATVPVKVSAVKALKKSVSCRCGGEE